MADVVATEERAPQRVGFLAALRYRGFLMLWMTHVTSSSQFWMEQVARPWLVYQMTDSVFLLGAVQAVRGLPVLVFTLIGGILSDRVDRNKLYMATRATNAASLVLLTVLLFLGRLEVWHVFVLTALGGIANAMEFPIRQSMIPELVPRHVILNALAISQVARQTTHVGGPSVAGVLIATSGIEGCYLVQCALALATAATPNLINAPRGSQAASHESVVENIAGAVRYVRGNDVVFALVLLALVPNLLQRSWQSMLPVFARDILQVGEVGFGMLNSATGIGALIGAVAIAVLGSVRNKGAILLLGAAGQAIGLVLFAFSPWFGASLLLIGLIGIVQTAYFSMNNALLLTHTDEVYRGRVLSLYDMDRGLIPLGSVLLGWLATVLGTPLAVALISAPIIPLALLVLWRVPRFRAAE